MTPATTAQSKRQKGMKKASGAPRSGKTTFRPRARLLRILGEELISDDVVAITELVKNAHDADATHVKIVFEGVTGPEGKITVTDDGDGMDIGVLLDRWMQPASSDKGSERTRRTRRGRRMLGEKGVGRFAVDKLASRLELVTRARRQKDELAAWFDWDEYSDDSRMLSEIQSHWKFRKPEIVKKNGTSLIMTGLRGEWTERSFRRMCVRLSRLIPPRVNDDTFRIEVESDEFPDYSGTVDTGFLDRSPYRVEAQFDGYRSILIKVNDDPATTVPWNGHEELLCGPVQMRFHAFDLETESLARLGSRMEARAWLKQWSGVSIYRDDFRVWPYGEPHDDWLRLDQRRVNNPTVCLSNNQIVGFVHLTADDNPQLRDQTNREGLINNDAFEHLRRLVLFAFQVLEAKRQTIRHPNRKERRAPGRVKLDGKHPIAREIEDLAGETKGRFSTRMKALAKRAHDHAEREEAGRRRVVEGLVELAAAGQAVGGLHEAVDPVIDSMDEQVAALRGMARGKKDLAAGIRALQSDISRLRTHLSVIEPMSEAVTRRRHSMDVRKEIESFREIALPVLDARGVKMIVSGSGTELLRSPMRPQTFYRMLHVLTGNALDWMRTSSRSPVIRIKLKQVDRSCELLFQDSGPGVPEEVADRIFEPHMSLKEGGKGIGLTIASSIVEQHGGELSLVRDRRIKGACFRILLPLQRSRTRKRS